MRFKYIFIVLGVLFGCNKETFSKVKVIGHAGNGLTVPHSIFVDNSMESIELALSHIGCDGVELDVQMDKDGRLWLFHDDNMARTSLKSGSISDYTTEELKLANYTSIHKEKLVQFNPYILSYGMGQTFFFDLKIYNATTGQNVDFQTYIHQLTIFMEVAQGFDYRFICKNRSFAEFLLQNGIKVYYEMDSQADLEFVISNAHRLKGVFVKNAFISKQEVATLQDKKLEVLIFNARSPKGIKEAMKKYPDYVVVDNIKTALIEKN